MLNKSKEKFEDKLGEYETKWQKYQKYSNILLTMLLALLTLWLTSLGIIGFKTEFRFESKYYPEFLFVMMITILLLLLLLCYIVVRRLESTQIVKDQKAEQEKIITQRAKRLFSPASLAEFLDYASNELDISIASKAELTVVSHKLVNLALLNQDTKESLQKLDKFVEPQISNPGPEEVPEVKIAQLEKELELAKKEISDTKATSRILK